MNTFGNNFRISIFGESHGPMIGVTMDGVPAGMNIEVEELLAELDRRKYGVLSEGGIGTTPRKESDKPEFVSGVLPKNIDDSSSFLSTGAPLTIVFKNENQNSKDYSQFVNQPRPGHADFVAAKKFHGFNDIRGGGHFSGRMTLCLVSAGFVARQMLKMKGGKEIIALAQLVRLAGKEIPICSANQNAINQEDATLNASENNGIVRDIIQKVVASGDSAGAVIECRVKGVPVGVGEPFFDSLESRIAHLAFSIPGVRGLEFGDGFAAADMKGSEHNDAIVDAQGKTETNGAGGINGGISNGNDIVFRVAFKPTSSIALAQRSFNFKTNSVEQMQVKGRHDACFALRCPAIVEAIAYIALAE